MPKRWTHQNSPTESIAVPEEIGADVEPRRDSIGGLPGIRMPIDEKMDGVEIIREEAYVPKRRE